MNTKRISALLLAAVMAVSTVTPAFAATPRPLDFPANASENYIYRKDKDGILQPITSYDITEVGQFIKPGESFYIPLTRDPDATDSEVKRINAFGDWQVGKEWVKGLDVVYAKANRILPSTTSYTYAKNKNITGNISIAALADLNSIAFTGISSAGTDAAVLSDLKTKFKAALTSGATTAYATELANKYSKGNELSAYYVKGGKLVFGTDNSITAGYTAMGTSGFIVGDKYYADEDRAKTAAKLADQAVGAYIGTGVGGKYFVDTAAVKIAFPVTQITAGVDATEFYALTDITATSTAQEVWLTNGGAPTQITGAGFVVKTNDGISGDKYHLFDTEANAIAHVTTKVTTVGKFYNTETFVPYDSIIAGGVNVSTADGSYYNNTADATTGACAIVSTKTAVANANGFIVPTATDYAANPIANGTAVVTEAAAKALINPTVDAVITNYVNALVLNDFTKTATSARSVGASAVGYSNFVEVQTKTSSSVKAIDIAGKVSVGTSKTNANASGVRTYSTDVTLSPGKIAGEVSGDVTIYPDLPSVVNFESGSEDIVIEFDQDARYEVRVAGQSSLNLAYNTKYVRDFGDMYDYANINFITFTAKPSFNKTGDLYIYADEDTYVYEVTNDGAKAINSASYDTTENAWVLRTRTLSSYAVSDKKLSTVTSSSSSTSSSGSSSTTPSYKPNPDTGR